MSKSSLVIDMDLCTSSGMSNEPYDYSEFTADINNNERSDFINKAIRRIGRL